MSSSLNQEKAVQCIGRKQAVRTLKSCRALPARFVLGLMTLEKVFAQFVLSAVDVKAPMSKRVRVCVCWHPEQWHEFNGGPCHGEISCLCESYRPKPKERSK